MPKKRIFNKNNEMPILRFTQNPSCTHLNGLAFSPLKFPVFVPMMNSVIFKEKKGVYIFNPFYLESKEIN